jgi:hypothetical protein
MRCGSRFRGPGDCRCTAHRPVLRALCALVPDSLLLGDLRPGNPSASFPEASSFFSPEPPGTFGNVKRNFLRGPGFHYTGMSLFKNFPLGRADSPRIIQLRLESYNLFNHPNFAPPDGNLSDGASFGTITSLVVPTADNGEGDPQLGRAVQLAGRFHF